MDKLPEIIPLSDLRQESASVFQRLQDGDSPMVITQRGRAAGVLLSMEGYEQMTKAYQLLQLLIAGEREIAADTGHDFDEVMAEADGLLGDE